MMPILFEVGGLDVEDQNKCVDRDKSTKGGVANHDDLTR